MWARPCVPGSPRLAMSSLLSRRIAAVVPSRTAALLMARTGDPALGGAWVPYLIRTGFARCFK